jgi:hypothetical protein
MRKLLTIKAVATATGVALIMFAAVVAQERGAQGGARPMSLTAMDFIEIQQLVVRYAKTLDQCLDNGYAYADLYTPDGWFASSRDGVLGTKFEGRERLAVAAGGGPNKCDKLNRPGGLWIHVMANHEIDPTPEGAKGHVDLVYPLEAGNGFDVEHSGHVGHYEDTYIKTDSGWKFRSRIHVMPPSRRGGRSGAPPAQQSR